jgi:hypothetical protein
MPLRPFVRCPHEQLGSHGTDLSEIWYLSVFRKFIKKVQVSLISNNNKGTLRKETYEFFIFRTRNISYKICKKINTILCSIAFFFFFRKSCLYEIMWKYIAEPNRPQMIIRRLRIACSIPKDTRRHSEYHALVQQWLHERTQCCDIRTLPVLFRLLLSHYMSLFLIIIINYIWHFLSTVWIL